VLLVEAGLELRVLVLVQPELLEELRAHLLIRAVRVRRRRVLEADELLVQPNQHEYVLLRAHPEHTLCASHDMLGTPITNAMQPSL
jgi:hypothetical protein